MILAIDTATRWLGLALRDETAVVAEVGWRCLNNHTTELTPAIEDLLHKANVTVADLTGIAVAIGPDSYTGLRVGLAMAKGLAMVHQTPLVGIDTLDIVAAGVPPQPGNLLTVIEAGRTRITTAVYDWQPTSGWQQTAPPANSTWSERLAGQTEPIYIAGEISAKANQLIEAHPHAQRVSPATAVRRAGHLAELGWHRFQQQELDDPITLTPRYLLTPAGA